MAMGALATTVCAKHFGLGGSRSMDPSTVLVRAAFATTTVTNLFFDSTTDDRVGASSDGQAIIVTTTDPWAYTATDGTKIESTRAKISINVSSWNNGSSTWRAGTLIHELGHVFNMLLGAGGSDFVYDALPGGAPNAEAEATNARILRDCIQD